MSQRKTVKRKFKNTRAYKLITDPTVLLSLLYSKYGDVEEDFNIMKINSLLYTKKSHIYIKYTEMIQQANKKESLRRYYKKHEAKKRIPEMYEYYKNYHLFFCRPSFRNTVLMELIRNNGDNQAEVFYKNNYTNEEENKNNKSIKNKINFERASKINTDFSCESSLSSFDNISENKTIFDKLTRHQIESQNKNEESLITLTLDNSKTSTNNGLVSKRSKTNSFTNLISEIMEQKKSSGIKVKINQNYNTCQNSPINISSPQDTIRANRKVNRPIIKSSLCTLTKGKIDNFIKRERNNKNNSKNNSNKNSNNSKNSKGSKNHGFNTPIDNRILLSPKNQPFISTFRSNIAEFNKNKPKIKTITGSNYSKGCKISYQTFQVKNKTLYSSHSNISGGVSTSTAIKNKSKYSNTNTNRHHQNAHSIANPTTRLTSLLRGNNMTLSINSNNSRYNFPYNYSSTLNNPKSTGNTIYETSKDNHIYSTTNRTKYTKSDSKIKTIKTKPATSITKKPKNPIVTASKPTYYSNYQNFAKIGLSRAISAAPKCSLTNKTKNNFSAVYTLVSPTNPSRIIKKTNGNFSYSNVFQNNPKIINTQRYTYGGATLLQGMKSPSNASSKFKKESVDNKRISRNAKFEDGNLLHNIKTNKTKHPPSLNYLNYKSKIASTIYEKVTKFSQANSKMNSIERKLTDQKNSKFMQQIAEILKKNKGHYISPSGSHGNIFNISPPKTALNTIKVQSRSNTKENKPKSKSKTKQKSFSNRSRNENSNRNNFNIILSIPNRERNNNIKVKSLEKKKIRLYSPNS
ncbi:MAG: hypothetical protein MJ252_22200 [archaeon]|nr:hypothetical protein [archaeon]